MGGNVGARHVIERGRPDHRDQAWIVRRQDFDQAQRIALAVDIEQGRPVGLPGVTYLRLEGIASCQQEVLEGALQLGEGGGPGEVGRSCRRLAANLGGNASGSVKLGHQLGIGRDVSVSFDHGRHAGKELRGFGVERPRHPARSGYHGCR